MKPFTEICVDNLYHPGKLLIYPELYFAHTGQQKPETLAEHTTLCCGYFVSIVESNGLEKVINKLISDLADSVCDSTQKENLAAFIKLIFFNTVLLHDIGKINDNFQYDLMQNKSVGPRPDSCFGTRHSLLGAIIFIILHTDLIYQSEFSPGNKEMLCVLLFLFSNSILRHHGKLNNGTNIRYGPDEIAEAELYLNHINFSSKLKGPELKALFEYFSSRKIREYREQFLSSDPYDAHLLLKLNYGLLTSADFYATTEYTMGIKATEFGTISVDLRNKFETGVSSIPYNRELDLSIDELINSGPMDLLEVNRENQSRLRQMISAEVLTSLRGNMNSRVFYLEAPTGGGKTNLSLLVARELLRCPDKVKKIFYVFPLITIITQTAKFLRDSIGLDPSEMTEIHSRALHFFDEAEDNYGAKMKNYLDYLFINYPITLLSHVRFFALTNDNDKESLYILPRLANSLVIIDELQSYNPEMWDKINYIITNFAEKFNIRFLLMSATLPKISQLSTLEKTSAGAAVVDLLVNKSLYFKNPNFAGRVIFSGKYLDLDVSENLSDLLAAVIEEGEYYYKNHRSARVIVEFVTIKRAHNFFDICLSDPNFDAYQKFILTSTILETRKREIIDYIKSGTNANKRVLLITTQVIEAGVDIDMDIGFKDIAIPDAEEQLAGRINRNAGKKDSTLFLFNSRDRNRVYQKDRRYKLGIKNKEHLEILNTKDFAGYYKEVLKNIDKDNKDNYLSGKLGSYKEILAGLEYSELVNELRLIEGNNLRVYVPIEIPVQHFDPGTMPFLETLQITTDDKADGKKLFEIYEDLVNNRDLHFIDKKSEIKLIYPLISMFSFSLSEYSKSFKFLSACGEEKLGFFYIYPEFINAIYSYENGLMCDTKEMSNFI